MRQAIRLTPKPKTEALQYVNTSTADQSALFLVGHYTMVQLALWVRFLCEMGAYTAILINVRTRMAGHVLLFVSP